MLLLMFFLLISPLVCSCLRILAVLPFPMMSHQIVFNILLEELVDKGHDVTVYSSKSLETNVSNYRHVHISTSLDKLEERFTFENVKSRIDMEAFIRPMGFQIFTRNFSEEVLNLPQIKHLLSSSEKFDVVILELFFGQEALVGFGNRFNAPVVVLSSFGSYSLVDSVMGNPNPLAYFSTYQLPYSNELTLYQRLKNLVATLSELHYSYYHHLPKQQEVLAKYFPQHSTTLSLVELLSNAAVVLLNTQPEVSYARPWVPNLISVGGLHIPTKKTPLSQEIQHFVDGADNGFIYFSLGSTFSAASIPEYIKEAFITAFKENPLKILWKIDVPPKDLPSNVLTTKWVKQVDVLAHPKCRVFITHGGLLSLLEAVHFGVPMIGLPMFADQPWNVVKAEHAEIGIRLQVLQVSAISVSKAIHEILHNPKYKRNIMQLSAGMRDKLVSPLETAVYWVQYVAKHQGAHHLRATGRNMSFFHYLMIDIILSLIFVVLLMSVILIVLYKCVIILLCKLTRGKSKVE